MRRFIVFLAASSFLGCAARDTEGGETTALKAESPLPHAVFVFDHDRAVLARLTDKNGDGDFNDAGESQTFFGGMTNSLSLLALGEDEVLATDNDSSSTILRLRDLDGDGDALDEGESSVWFSGALPGGFRMRTPVGLAKAGSSIYFVDKNFTFPQNPEAIYKADDQNGDGDVDDPGEVVSFSQLAAPGTVAASVWDLTFDGAGNAWVIDTYQKFDENKFQSVSEIAAGSSALTKYYDDIALFHTSHPVAIADQGKIDYAPRTGEVMHIALSGDFVPNLVAVKAPGRGVQGDDDIRILWNASRDAYAGPTGIPRDFALLADESVIFSDKSVGQLVHLVDANADGDFNDPGEYRIAFDAAMAGPSGSPIANVYAVAVVR